MNGEVKTDEPSAPRNQMTQSAPSEREAQIESIMTLVDVYADAFHGACLPSGGISFADGLVAKIRKDEIRKALDALLQAARAAPAELTDEQFAAMRRLWPLWEHATKGYVFTAEKAGEVIADMNTVRTLLKGSA